jgi:hypothetical protein
MKISRSGYYKWLKRKGIDNRYIEYRKYLLNEIKLVYSKHKTWGYHRIAAKIRNDTGLIFSDLLIHKICKANNIYSKARKKPYKKPCEEHVIYSNNIQGNWNTTSPFQKIATDTTILWKKGKYYDLTMYIEYLPMKLIAYISRFPSMCISIQSFKSKMIDKRKNKKRLIKQLKRGPFRSGVIYTSFAYTNAFKDYHISRSLSRRATPTENHLNLLMDG